MLAEAAGAPKKVPLVALQAGRTQHCNSFKAFFAVKRGTTVKKATLCRNRHNFDTSTLKWP
jgi:hypothetical protein